MNNPTPDAVSACLADLDDFLARHGPEPGRCPYRDREVAMAGRAAAVIRGLAGEVERLKVQEEECRQVAALLAMDIDLLADIAQDYPEMSADRLRKHILRHKEGKDETVSDSGKRRGRYDAASMLFALADTGMIRCEPIRMVDDPSSAEASQANEEAP